MISKVAFIVVFIIDVLTSFVKKNETKITYISYRSANTPYCMKSLSDEIKNINQDTEHIFLNLKFTNTLLSKIKYGISLIEQVYHIKTSKIVFIDGNNFVVSNLRKKYATVIQIWHASGAIKKFGMDYKRKYPIKNYDYIVTSSTKLAPFIASAFNVNLDQVKALGYIDNDVIFDIDKMNSYKSEMIEKYPILKNKKVILYTPTFRGEGVYDKLHTNINLKLVSDILGDNYVILYKMHPILENISLGEGDNIINLSKEDIYKLFAISDLMVSDYSSVIFDYSLTDKPVILHAPDLDEYKRDRGLYLDYEKFSPYTITKTEAELAELIKSNEYANWSGMYKFKRDYFDNLDGNSSKRIAEFTNEILMEVKA